jgi:1-acyl-sn-glycerol-3-phosphate acyltransferase
MTVLRSLAFNVAFGVVTIVMGLIGLPLLLAPGRWTHVYARVWTGVCMTLLRWIVGLEFEIRGTPPTGAALIAAKHQSAWETLALELILPAPAFVMKQTLLWTPPFGPYLWKAGMIAIDRSAGGKAIRRLVDGAAEAFEENRPVVIFPEGTRRDPGAEPSYHPGIAAVYRGLRSSVVPVALNSGLFWGRNAFAKRPGRIIIEFLEPIESGLDRRGFMAQLEDRIETATRALVQESENQARIVG